MLKREYYNKEYNNELDLYLRISDFDDCTSVNGFVLLIVLNFDFEEQGYCDKRKIKNSRY